MRIERFVVDQDLDSTQVSDGCMNMLFRFADAI